jgi:hypothetical protein
VISRLHLNQLYIPGSAAKPPGKICLDDDLNGKPEVGGHESCHEGAIRVPGFRGVVGIDKIGAPLVGGFLSAINSEGGPLKIENENSSQPIVIPTLHWC